MSIAKQTKFIANTDISKRCAEILLLTKSVMIANNADEYFTLTSGKKSPVYVDCRKLISYPKERAEIISYAKSYLTQHIDINDIDFIAGGETAGIPYAAWLSEKLQKPMIYIRKKPKGFGKMAQIEGDLSLMDAPRILLVEDMATDGGSKVLFIDAIRKAGGQIDKVFCPFFYDIFERSKQILQENNFSIYYLTNWKNIIEFAENNELFSYEVISNIKEFLKSPDRWQEKYL